jgi:hypothetical protein
MQSPLWKASSKHAELVVRAHTATEARMIAAHSFALAVDTVTPGAAVSPWLDAGLVSCSREKGNRYAKIAKAGVVSS